MAERAGGRALRLDAAAPVFVLGCSWRCGSTLVQRYLNSTREVFIWGEQAGLLSGIPRAAALLKGLRPLSRMQRDDFLRSRDAAWIANVSPDLQAFLLPALRQFLEAFYRKATRELGVARWGFKEVRYDAAVARLLLGLFPNGRVVFLVRDPAAVLASSAATEWHPEIGGAEGVIGQWKSACRSFLDLADPRVLRIRYEDLVDDPAPATALLSVHLGIAVERFSASVLEAKVRGTTREPVLGGSERQALRGSGIADLAARYGYRVAA